MSWHIIPCITYTPAICSHTPRLTTLDLSSNDLRELPQYIFELPVLTVLNVSYNWLKSLSPAVSDNQRDELESIRTAASSDTRPQEDGAITLLSRESDSGASQETTPNDRRGTTTSTTDVVSDLGSSTSSTGHSPREWKCVNVEKLDVSHNAFSQLPVEITQLRLLRKLRVHHNHLRCLPPVWRRCPYLVSLPSTLLY